MFSYVSPEARIPADHPLRSTREMTNRALDRLDRKFRKLYSRTGRPSIPPEQLLRALLLQILYSIRSERMLMEQLEYNLLFRWFVGLEMDDRVWDVTVFTKNRNRLLQGEIAEGFFQAVLEQAREASLLSDEHFTVDGTLIEAWAGQKSFRPKDEDGGTGSGGARPSERDFHGERRKNDTHASTTDPEARLFKKGKGKEAKLCFMGHVITENRNGLVVAAETTLATGTAEREASEGMMERVPRARRSRRTWRRTTRIGAARSMIGRRATWATTSASASARRWSRSSAGARSSARSGRRSTGAWNAWAGCTP
jgi:transposase